MRQDKDIDYFLLRANFWWNFFSPHGRRYHKYIALVVASTTNCVYFLFEYVMDNTMGFSVKN